MEYLKILFLSPEFMPHGYCYLWNPGLVWLHVISDALIFLAYTSIPITLFYFVRKRRDLPFHWMFVCFGVFIVACGLTHGMEVWNLWHAAYWVAGGVKAVTALASVSTAVLLVQMVPDALTIPSPDELRKEIAARQRAQEEIARRNARLMSLIQNSPLGIVLVDAEGRVEMCNSAYEQLFLFKLAEIEGKFYTELFPEDVASWAPLAPRILAGEAVLFRSQRRRKDGEFREVEVHAVPLLEGGKFAGAYALYQDITEHLKWENSLRESEQIMRDLTNQLLLIQDEERRRIGRELHDSAGQYLGMLKMHLDTLETGIKADDPVRRKLQDCIELADETLRELRSTSYELFPPLLDETGLKSAIPWYLDGFTERCGILTRFEITGDMTRPSREVELALFRVLQESLTNVRRHSGSSRAAVRLHMEKGSAMLEVADQGGGIPAEILEAFHQESFGKLGVGLRGMKERIRQLGGKLEIASNGQGTLVSAMVPSQKQ